MSAWHLVFLLFFAFSIIRFAIYLSHSTQRTRRMSTTNWHYSLADVRGEVRNETGRAWQFYNGTTTVWLPKSQCEWDAGSKVMTMPEWLAKEKGLI